MADFVLKGETFAARDELKPHYLGRVGSAMQKGDAMKMLGAWYDFMMAVVLPHDRGRFEAFLDDEDVTQKELDEAIGTYIQTVTGRPLEQPSSSAPGSTSTGLPTRVVSLAPVTDPGEEETDTETAPPMRTVDSRSLMAGQQQAS
jgi:hypothetical protein